MAWPISQDYNEAIQNPHSSFSDPELREGQPVTTPLGLPLPRSGTFADVYEVGCPTTQTRWAVKCFTRAVPGLRDRYTEISRHLEQARLPFTVDFTYLEQGIRVRGAWYPVLKMRWVEGLLLNDLVRSALDKPALLETLGQIWLRMARRLREARVAHGDLQHGNVLLVPGSKTTSLAVKLVDYDGMFVPALAGNKSGEVGHPAYQHPLRLREGSYGPDVDRFPLLVIATALRCLAVGGRPLWDRYDNGDNLLFREADLRAPAESALFKELWQLRDPTAHMLVGHLALASQGTLEQVPLVDELLADGGTLRLTASQEKQATALLGAAHGAPGAEPVVAAGDATLDFGPAGSSPSTYRRRRRAGKLSGWVKVGGAAALAVLVGFVIWSAGQGTGTGDGQPAAGPSQSSQGKQDVPTNPIPKEQRQLADNERPAEPPPPPPRLLNRTQLVRVGGNGGTPFEDVPEGPAFLVGFHYTTVDFGGGAFIKSLQPIYLTVAGRTEGAVRGQPAASRKTVEAREGYAVGGIRASQGPDDLKLLFLRLHGTKLDPADSYESPWLVGRGREPTVWLAGTGQSVVGIHGRAGANADALGLVTEGPDVAPTEKSPDKEADTGKPADKLPVPAAEALAAAEQKIKEVHKADYARRKPSELRALATKLLQEGRETRNQPALRFVLLREARDLAADAGSPALALEAAGDLARDYVVDALEMKTTILERVSRSAISVMAYKVLVTDALALMEEGMAADNYDPAGRLLKIAEAALPKAVSPSLATLVQARGKELDRWRAEFERVRPAADKLARDPNDPDANLVVGKFRCLEKGNWGRGLPLLVRGSDGKWKELAGKDLADPTGFTGQVEVGDGWWDLAKTETGAAQMHLKGRAYGWYQRAVADLTGLEKTRIEQRLKEAFLQHPDLETVGLLQTLRGHKGNLYGVAIAPTGRRALSASDDKTIRVWDLEAGKEARTFPSSGGLAHVLFFPDGRTALAAQDKTLFMFDLQTGKPIRRFPGPSAGILSTALSADGRYVLCAGHDKTARMWEAATGRPVSQFNGHDHIVHAVAMSPDSRLVLTGSFDGTVRLWEAATGKEMRRFEGSAGEVTSVAFAPDGRRALSGANDASVRLWDVATGKEVRRFVGHDREVRSVVFSPDGRRALSGSYDKTVRLWDIETGKEVCRLEGSAGGINDVVFSPDGRRALSGGMDGALCRWGLPRW